MFLDKVILKFEKVRESDNIKLKYSDDLVCKIVDKSDYKILGARAVLTSIQHEFIDRVVKYLLENNSKDCVIKVDCDSIESKSNKNSRKRK